MAAQHEREERVLTQGTAAIVRSISDAVVAKDGEPFFICPPDGQVPCSDGHGYGLYHHDCRFLGGYELTVAGARPSSLAATEAAGTHIELELTNPDIRMADNRLISKEQLGITWSRRVAGDAPGLEDDIEVRNYGREPVAFPIEVRFRAKFEDVFEIRGLLRKEEGRLLPPAWRNGRLEFGYAGADGVDRSVRLTFDPEPADRGTERATFSIKLPARGRATVRIRAAIDERLQPGAAPIERRDADAPAGKARAVGRVASTPDGTWIAAGSWATSVRTTSLVLEATLERSFADLAMLRARLDGHRYYEAGIPWFATLFGRDALISALQTLAFEPTIAADTLRLLAGRQGRAVQAWRDEEPGKILHELRIGELARLGEIPHSPYFGTIDATPLFLILLGRHAAWTGQVGLFQELAGPVEQALGWLERKVDSGEGFVDYSSTTRRGLVNQGWKDSGDAIVARDGSLAEPPIALVEVQGYVYRAWLETADLFERSGHGDRAIELRRRAADLRERFEYDFWSDDLGCYILARASGKNCEVVASNAGHALWTEIASPERARATAACLMAPDMFNGWGIRTLSFKASAYHPIGYHLGTVWPHDNSIIADGFRRYGLDDEAERMFVGMIEAAQDFPHARLPECFAGYDRASYGVPVRYPVACHPQAWAAGAIPSMLVSILGLTPDGFGRRLEVRRPRLPAFLGSVEIRGLTVGEGSAHLRFERRGSDTVVDVVSVDGDLEVLVDDVDAALIPGGRS